MDEKTGIEKLGENLEVDVIGIDDSMTLASIKDKVCDQCRAKIKKYTNGDYSNEALCPKCTTLIQTMLGNRLL